MKFPPRFPLATLPTPLQEARRLRAALGGDGRCPRILIKRDDLTGLAFGGNKGRKLEFIIAEALRQGAATVITTGAAQSNHARMTAAAARLAGLDCALVLTSPTDHPALTGNLLLDRLLGADVHVVPASDDPRLPFGHEAAKVDELVETLTARGRRPYVIPVGGSSAFGALGYVVAAMELAGQLLDAGINADYLYFPSGSRGTQAGLTLGARALNATYRLRGIAVSGGEAEKVVRGSRVANEAAVLLGIDLHVGEADVTTDQGYIGAAYGVPTPACLDAIVLLAHTEGLFLDPVYSGKAMAGLLDHIRTGRISPSETVVFLHTGGTPALFAHAETLEAAARAHATSHAD